LTPVCDLAPSAGLEWIIEAKPRAIANETDLIPLIALVVAEARLKRFREAHGGIDLRRIDELCVAHYTSSTLTLARTPFDPNLVERTFSDRLTNLVGRHIEVPRPQVLRLSGDIGTSHTQLILFGDTALALEETSQGVPPTSHATPLRATVAFAMKKLRRATPALNAPSVARAARLLGDAPIRAFAVGPFGEGKVRSLGGLARASTTFAVSARFAAKPTNIALRVVLLGAWGAEHAPEAASRLAAAAHVVAESSLGRLLGLDHPIVGPRVATSEDAIILDATLDGSALAHGLHDALDADIASMMSRIETGPR
jgi:hypothetical protein